MNNIQDDDIFEEDLEDSQKENEIETTAQTNNKNKKRNKKKKNKNKSKSNKVVNDEETNKEDDEEEKVEIEFVPDEVKLDPKDPAFSAFQKVFEHFKLNGNAGEEKKKSIFDDLDKVKAPEVERLKYSLLVNEDEEERSRQDEVANDDKTKLSKKKHKQATRMSVAELKQLVNRPDVVEMHDVTARDPKLLVNLKATRNTVPVPRHWCAKRKYLQGKRGFEKPAFDLPDFIKRTGITEMRHAVSEKEDSKSLKQKMREKVRPKMGKIDIDYQKLHDAFFRYQTKPRMSIHGDLYYEGKEFETKLREKKPGNFTDELRVALGMPTGHNSDKVPPPWLIAMQRYGPPPSYPNLRIAGLNAPIPDSCSFGYHAGGWGKPPVDEFGRPLYGDVFGGQNADHRRIEEDEQVDRALWGELEDQELEEVEPMVESDEEEDADLRTEDMTTAQTTDLSGTKTPGEGLATPSGISTTTSGLPGLETPDMIELRKRKQQIEKEMESDAETPTLYKVLPEKATNVGTAMMGSSKVYDINAAKKVSSLDGSHGSTSGIDVALNPDELDMDSDTIKARYDAQVRSQASGQTSTMHHEDLSDMVAEHAAQQNKKRKKPLQQPKLQDKPQTTDKPNKKQKEFKF